MRFSVVFFFFCKQKTAYEMRISDWSSDVCSFRSPRQAGCEGAARICAATPRLSSRHLLPGPNALTARPAAGEKCEGVSGHTSLLAPMGPGDKPRGDNGDRKSVV